MSVDDLGYDHLSIQDVWYLLQEFITRESPWLKQAGAQVLIPADKQVQGGKLRSASKPWVQPLRGVLDVFYDEVPQVQLEIPEGRLILRTTRSPGRDGSPFVAWAVILLPPGSVEAVSGPGNGVRESQDYDLTTHLLLEAAKKDFIQHIDPLVKLSFAHLPLEEGNHHV